MLKQKEIGVGAKFELDSGFVLAECEGLSERMRERLEDYMRACVIILRKASESS